MSVSTLITNLTASPVRINDLYTTLGPAGSSNASITITRTVAQLDMMDSLQELLSAGTVSAVPTVSSDNADIVSIPLEQHGTVGVTVQATGEVLTPITFSDPYPVGVKPRITCRLDKTGVTAARGQLYIQSVTNAGFTLSLDVTTAVAAENPVWSPPESQTTVGPFTATLAAAPLTDAPLTINWTESIQATGTLTATGTIVDGDTVTVGATTYTFKSPFVDVAGNVFIGASNATALANLVAAITAGAGAGTLYGTGTTANASAGASVASPTTVFVYALLGGTAGNSVASTTTGGHVSFGGATLSGGTAPTAKVATLSGTSTLSGTNASRLAAVSVNRTSGAISITFNPRTIGTNDGPDTNSLTVGYGAVANWTAAY